MVRLQRLLFAVAAGFWLVTGALVLGGVPASGFGSSGRVLGVFMLGNGVALGLCGWYASRGRRTVDYAAFGVALLNALLSVTDEAGPLDIASLLVSVALLLLVVANRRAT